MKRQMLYLHAVFAAVALVLLAAAALNYLALQDANRQIGEYQRQQRQMALAIALEHAPEMQAARSWWISGHPAAYRDLQAAGIDVEADYLETPGFSAVLDPADPGYIRFGPSLSAAEAGEVIVGLGQFYDDNMTRASSWSATYIVSAASGAVSGFSASMAHDIAYAYYLAGVAPSIHEKLGVSSSAVQGVSPLTLDTSYLPERGLWLDVTEYKYGLKNTNMPAYLTVKTYVNASTEAVEGVEVSAPYYATAGPILH